MAKSKTAPKKAAPKAAPAKGKKFPPAKKTGFPGGAPPFLPPDMDSR